MTDLPRYVVGIDLGTTNSAVAYVDASSEDSPIQVFSIPQLVAPGQVEPRITLPSFLYLPAPHDFGAKALSVPWNDSGEAPLIGELARTRGAEVPARLVASAKSWLCHPTADRKGPILPWGADAAKISPVDAAKDTLSHMACAWAHAFPDAPLGAQDVFLTVPASFDAVARELTMVAARRAGLERVTLLEEPQSAFYSWLARAGERWRRELKVGDIVLVCDVGGGTTDFSLIEVVDRGGNLELERVAVGDHILLGGDNMDLALSYRLAQKLGSKGTQLDAWQQRSLTQACRGAKEELLGQDKSAKVPVAILGRGSKLIGGTLKTELERADVEATLLEGFFPACASTERVQRSRRTGFQELGLPYAADPALTRHLAEFLSRHGRTPTAILYNGGVMKGQALRTRLHQVVESWGTAPLKTLEGTDLDLAVAHGAAYYGLVRRGRGVRIRGGAARAYYLGVETAMPAIPGMPPPLKALCVVPFGMEEGTEAELPHQEFGLIVGEPAEFRFLSSSSRPGDQLGDVIERFGDEIEELAPLETVLEPAPSQAPGQVVPVRLLCHVTAVGTLELYCVSRDDSRRWKLEFHVRDQAP